MKPLYFLLIPFAFLSTKAQESFSENDAKAIVDTFFKGFHKGDTVLMRSVMVKNLPTQTVFTTGKGEPKIVDGNGEDFLKAIGKRPADQIWEEKLLNYKIQVDGNLAHVWTPYEFWLNGSFSHCGANAFTIGKTQDGWKILHLIDSRRKEGCILIKE